MRITILMALLLLALTANSFAQETAKKLDSIFNLKQFVDLFIGFLFAFFSFFIRDWWVRRRDRKNRQKRALQSIIKELEMILDIIENEKRVENDPKQDIAYEFTTQAWDTFFGEVDLPSEDFKATQEAYSVVSKINRFARQTRAIFSMDYAQGGKAIKLQKQFAKGEGSQLINSALEKLRKHFNENYNQKAKTEKTNPSNSNS